MRNQYGGTCYRCGEHCNAGDGHYERVTQDQYKKWSEAGFNPRERWLVQHVSCAIVWRGTDRHFKYAPIERAA